jgi:multidrug efflux pump
MYMIEFFLKKRIFTFVIIILLAYLGVSSLLRMRVESLPEVNAPVIYVAVPLPGGAPEEVEALITNPIEEKLAEIEDVDRVMSSSWQNVSLVVVFFKETVKPEEKFKEFREKIAELRPSLPSETMDPIIEEISFENLPMMFLGFRGGGRDQAALSRYAAKIQKEIEAVSGVKKVVMTGALDKHVEVLVDPDELRKYGTGPLHVLLEKLKDINTNMPGGKTQFGKEYVVRTIGKFESIDDLRDMVVGTYATATARFPGAKAGAPENVPVRLSDIASVREKYPDATTIVHVDGARGVTLAIMKKKGYGTINVADRIKKVIAKYPDAVIMSDSSETVRSQMGDLRNHAIWGICLVMLVLFISLGFKVAAIVSFAIPMSILMTFTAMGFRDMTLDMVSLFALLLALGMMVDNSIVVCENIYRHMSLGKSSMQAAIDATNEVSWPILSSTGAVVAAFLPIAFFLKGPIGEFTRPIPIVVTFALISSLFVANFLNPVLCDTFMKSVPGGEGKNPRRTGRAKAFYGRLIEWCIDHGAIVMSAACALLVVCVLLVVFKVVGLQLFPQLDTAKFYIDLKTPAGSSLEDTAKVVRDIEDIFKKSGYVKNYIANIGSSGTRVEIDDNIYFGSNIARFIVDLKPMAQLHKSHKTVIQELRYRIGGEFKDRAQVTFIEKVLGPPVGAPINIQVSGPDYERLRAVSEQIEKLLSAQRGVVDLKDNYPGTVPQIILHINHDELGRLGLTTRDLGGYIFLTLTGYSIGDIMLDGAKKDIFLKVKQSKESDAAALQNASFKLPTGEEVRFGQLVRIEFADGLGAVEHENGKRTVTIQANVAAGVEPKRIIDKMALLIPPVRKRMAAEDPEVGKVRIKFAGETMLLAGAMRNLTAAVIVSLVFIYLILLVEFKSTTQPLIILVCVPYALVGVILTLLVLGYAFSILAGIGLLCLIGIVVNNGIIYIDYANMLQERGKSRKEACIEACLTRVRPIILTKATVILGIIPLATASASKTQFWKPLCWAIIGGLVIATTLTLVIIPVAYYIVEGWRRGYYKHGRQHLATAGAPPMDQPTPPAPAE